MQKLKVADLLTSLENVHRDVGTTLSESGKRAVDRHNAKTHILSYKPTMGDYFVVGRTQGPRIKM